MDTDTCIRIAALALAGTLLYFFRFTLSGKRIPEGKFEVMEKDAKEIECIECGRHPNVGDVLANECGDTGLYLCSEHCREQTKGLN